MLKIFKSRTVWVFIALFVINGFTGAREMIPAGYLPAVDGFLALLGVWFRTSPKVQF